MAKSTDTSPLTAEQEKSLFATYRAANTSAAEKIAARDRILLSGVRYLRSIARDYATSDDLIDDLVNEAMIALMHALEKFDPARGVRFLSYATFGARAAMQGIRAAELNVLGSTALNNPRRCQVQNAKRHAAATVTSDAIALASRYGMSEARAQALLDLFDSWATAQRNGAQSLASGEPTPEAAFADAEESALRAEWLRDNLECLTPRDRAVIAALHLDPDAGEQSFASVARTFGVSRERVRQIEQNAIVKLSRRARAAA